MGNKIYCMNKTNLNPIPISIYRLIKYIKIVMPIITKLSTTYLSLQIIVLFRLVIKVLQFRSNGKILTDIQIKNKLFNECTEIKVLY